MIQKMESADKDINTVTITTFHMFKKVEIQKKLLEMKNISVISKKIVNGINRELTSWPSG